MDHDRLFKELLRTFFFEFVELLLPDLAEFMERDYIEFLDKEIFTDIASSERHEVDLLVKVRFRDRGDAFFLIHIENQSSAQKNFPFRLFCYFAHLHEKYQLPIYPIAIFSFDHPRRAEPDYYQLDFPNHRVLDFRFRAIQLNRLNWRDFLRNPNPVASALMTRMSISPEDRPWVKLECLRMLVTLKLDKARATLIGEFMNNYLKLTSAEMMVYNRELAAIDPVNREVIMKISNEWVDIGIVEGSKKTVLRQLRRKFAALPPEVVEQIEHLPEEHIDELTDALLDFQTLADVQGWLAQHP